MQAGAGTVLNAPDSTGAVPSQLAREKGHRFLAHYLEEYVNRHVNKSRRATIFIGVQSSFGVLHARMARGVNMASGACDSSSDQRSFTSCWTKVSCIVLQTLDAEGSCIMAAQYTTLPAHLGPHPWAPSNLSIQGQSCHTDTFEHIFSNATADAHASQSTF